MEQIHLTLEFLGNVEGHRIAEFEKAIRHAVSGVTAFSVAAQKLGCFPNALRPRIIWAGLESADLRQLKERLDVALGDIGHSIEKRKFHPHLTLGRATHLSGAQARQISRELSRIESTDFGAWGVEEILLMQSTLSSSGASYSALQTFPLVN